MIKIKRKVAMGMLWTMFWLYKRIIGCYKNPKDKYHAYKRLMYGHKSKSGKTLSDILYAFMEFDDDDLKYFAIRWISYDVVLLDGIVKQIGIKA